MLNENLIERANKMHCSLWWEIIEMSDKCNDSETSSKLLSIAAKKFKKDEMRKDVE